MDNTDTGFVDVVMPTSAARIVGVSVERLKQLERAGRLSSVRTRDLRGRDVRLFLVADCEALRDVQAARRAKLRRQDA